MRALPFIILFTALAMLPMNRASGEGEGAGPSVGVMEMDFADAPNLILNPGFESDAGGAVVWHGKEAHFSANGDGLPDDWKCERAVLDTEVAHSGRSSVRLTTPGGGLASTNAVIPGKTVTSILPKGVPVLISAWSRAEGVPEGSLYRLQCNVGGQPCTLDFTPGTHDWERKSVKFVPQEDFSLPLVSITFKAPEGSDAKVWFDDISIAQQQPYPNLVVNAGFEQIGYEIPPGWDRLPADYQPYWGGYYWPAAQDTFMSHRGGASMRCSAAYNQIGGAAQTMLLRQKEARPIIVGAYCRVENLLSDNFVWLAAETWYNDGKKETETARVWLGKGAHDWDYRTFTIVPRRPVERIVVKAEIRPSLRTASVWLDDVYVAEVRSTPEELRARGVNVPAEVDCPSLDKAAPETPVRWDEVWTQGAPVKVAGSRAALARDNDNLYVALSAADDHVQVMLSPFGVPGVDSIDHISFYRFSVSRDGKTAAESAIDQDGYVFYLSAELPPPGWTAEVKDVEDGAWTALIRIPFAPIGMNRPYPSETWGLNLAAGDGDDAAQQTAWAGTYEDFRSFGALRFLEKTGLELTNVSLGDGLPDRSDMSDAWIVRSEVPPEKSIFRAQLINRSAMARVVRVSIGDPVQPPVPVTLDPGQSWDVALPYYSPVGERQAVHVRVGNASIAPDLMIGQAFYPMNVPQPIQLRMDQLFYYPDEPTAILDIACVGIPPDEPASLRLKVLAESTGETITEKELPLAERQATELDISGLSVSSEPVRDYRCLVELMQDGEVQASGSVTFGRMERPHFPPQPPVEKVEIGADGAMHINGKPFLLIVASLRDNGPYDRASAMGFNTEKANVYGEEAAKARIDDAWKRNVYFIVSHFAADDKTRENVARYAATQPGVIMHVGDEVQFPSYTGEWDWKRARQLAEWDPKHPTFWEYSGGAGHWYWRVLGRDPFGPISQMAVFAEGGPLGRLVPRAFDLERAAHIGPRLMYGAVVPFRDDRADYLEPGGWHQNMRSFSWLPFEQVRADCYLAIIHGSRGIYYYDPGLENQIDEARGLAVELRLLSPVILSPEVPRTVSLLPARNHIDVMQREYRGKTYVITCNRSEEPQQVEFRLPNLSTDTPICRRFEPVRAIERSEDGGGFKDIYGPYEVHVYDIG